MYPKISRDVADIKRVYNKKASKTIPDSASLDVFKLF
jgi:hypothetical protein